MMHLLPYCIMAIVGAHCHPNGLDLGTFDLSSPPSTGYVSFDVQIGWGQPTSSPATRVTTTRMRTITSTKTSFDTHQNTSSLLSAEGRTKSETSPISPWPSTWNWRGYTATSSMPNPCITTTSAQSEPKTDDAPAWAEVTQTERWSDGDQASAQGEAGHSTSIKQTSCACAQEGGTTPWNWTTGLPAPSRPGSELWTNGTGRYFPTGYGPSSAYQTSSMIPYSAASQAVRLAPFQFFVVCYLTVTAEHKIF